MTFANLDSEKKNYEMNLKISEFIKCAKDIQPVNVFLKIKLYLLNTNFYFWRAELFSKILWSSKKLKVECSEFVVAIIYIQRSKFLFLIIKIILICLHLLQFY